jgi:integrase
MARPKNQTPTYKLHSSTGLARCWVGGKWVTLGEYGSPESRTEFARLVAELATGPAAAIDPMIAGGSNRPGPRLIVDEVLIAFLAHAERHYRGPAGEPTDEVREIKRSLLYVHELYGTTPATEFGPRALAAVRGAMVGAGWCRTLVNRRMDRIKRAFKWATSQELVPVTVYDALRTLAGLQKGRTAARESDPVKPVDPVHVAATLPFLTTHLRCMAELQLLTGMRPGEAAALRFEEIDRTGDVWVFRPEHHKTAHRGQDRAIAVGPKARAVLVAFLRRDGIPPAGFEHVEPNTPDHRDARLVMADAYQEAGRDRDATLLRDTTRAVMMVEGCAVDPGALVFCPAEAQAERFRAARAARKSKVPPSQMNRRKANPDRKPGSKYTVAAYGYAVRKAAEKGGVAHWHPNQLRHTFATAVRKAHGLEAAQVLLGHARADVTQIYSERNLALALKVAAAMG